MKRGGEETSPVFLPDVVNPLLPYNPPINPRISLVFVLQKYDPNTRIKRGVRGAKEGHVSGIK